MICRACKGRGWIGRYQCTRCRGGGEEIVTAEPEVKEEGRFVCSVGRKPNQGEMIRELLRRDRDVRSGGRFPKHELRMLARMISRMRCGEPAEADARWRVLL